MKILKLTLIIFSLFFMRQAKAFDCLWHTGFCSGLNQNSNNVVIKAKYLNQLNFVNANESYKQVILIDKLSGGTNFTFNPGDTINIGVGTFNNGYEFNNQGDTIIFQLDSGEFISFMSDPNRNDSLWKLEMDSLNVKYHLYSSCHYQTLLVKGSQVIGHFDNYIDKHDTLYIQAFIDSIANDTCYCPMPNNNTSCAQPIINGDTVLCPNDNGQLYFSNVLFDSCKWEFASPLDLTFQSHPNGSNDTINVNSSEVGYQYRVITYYNNCIDTSEILFLDGYTFSPISTTELTPQFYNSTTGKYEICTGDTVRFEINLPFDTLITVHDNSFTGIYEFLDTINQVKIHDPGQYYIKANTKVCPNYDDISLSFEIVQDSCTSSITDNEIDNIIIYPNPAKEYLNFKGISRSLEIEIYSMTGKLSISKILSNESSINVSDLKKGMYLLVLKQNNQIVRNEKLIIN